MGNYWKVTLECGCTSDWEQPDAFAVMPALGMYAYCERHGDTTVAAVTPDSWTYTVRTLSERKPAQGLNPGSGFTPGDQMIVFWSVTAGSWAYRFDGVSRDGLAYESDDYTGFATPAQALAAGLAHYNESQQA